MAEQIRALEFTTQTKFEMGKWAKVTRAAKIKTE